VVNQLAPTCVLSAGLVTATVDVGESRILLRIERDSVTIVERVWLGISVGGVDLGTGSTLVRAVERTIVEDWVAHSGKSRGAHTLVHRELDLELRHETGREWVVRLRVSADGVAVRYAIPGLEGVSQLTADGTTVDLASFDRAWVLDYQTWYETPRVGVDLVALPDGDYGFPFLAGNPGGDHLLVSESGIDGRYSGAHPKVTGGDMLEFVAADGSVEIARGDVTPWRVFLVGPLEAIVESLFVDELAPPVHDDADEFTWVRPGRAAWSWWSDFYSGAQLEQQKRFVDAAAKLSWEHLLIDCGWEETWVPEIVAYASRFGIQVHLWTVWHDLDGPEKLAKLALWRSWGVAGIKVDFMESESKDRYRWYDSVLQETARLGLMVNFHGSVIPRGWARTWPHVVGYEAIRGSEYYVFYNDTPLTAEHNVIQPFTRNVVGAMDYTPVAFSAPLRTTSDAHELALSVAFECGITHFADDVSRYLERPLVATFLAQLAPTWDETLLVAGTPDTEAVVARRSGDRWFIGCIAAGAARMVTVPLQRLGLGNPTAWIVTDGPEGLEERTVDGAATLEVQVAADGGFVAIVAAAGVDLFASTPTRQRTVPTVSPELAELDANLEATITVTDSEARVRVAPGWTATPESDGRWRIRAPRTLAAGQLGIVTVETTDADPVVPTVAHVRLLAPLAAGVSRASSLPMLAFVNESGPVERDQSNGGGNPDDGQPMRIAGNSFDDGFGVSTPSTFDLHLGGRAVRFTALVGIDDETPGTRCIAVVSGDGIELFSAPVAAGDEPLPLDVDVADVDILTLSTREVGGNDHPAHVDWASARLVANPAASELDTPDAGH